jgi:uncharacterized protein YdaU (DUF1376 family)
MSFAFMPLYTGDYLRDTRSLTPLKHGIYGLLLIQLWDTREPLPLDEQECAGIAKCRSSDEIDAMRFVLSKFFIKCDDGYYNKRMSEEIAKAEILSDSRSKAGKIGASVRARSKVRSQYRTNAKQEPNNSLASAKQESVPLPPQLPLQPNQEKPSPADAGVASIAVDAPSPSGIPRTDSLDSSGIPRNELPGVPRVPHAEIVASFHASLPMAVPVKSWDADRQELLRVRWREDPQRQNLDWWQRFFRYVARSEFLTGQAASPGRKPFALTLEWLLKRGNFRKVIEGNYHDAKEHA